MAGGWGLRCYIFLPQGSRFETLGGGGSRNRAYVDSEGIDGVLGATGFICHDEWKLKNCTKNALKI